MDNPHWPLFGLRVCTPRLELRYPDDDVVAAVATLAGRGVHPPAEMPFSTPWTDAPPGDLERDVCRFLWRTRASWTPGDWQLPLAVLADGEVAGIQEIGATGFATLRRFGTGSWLGRAFQGRGIGTEMRAAVLHLGFDGLGGLVAESGAFADNPASHAVSAKLGYVPNGERRERRRGEAATMLGLRLDRDVWAPRRRDDITIDGLEACLAMFGVEPS